MQKNNKDLRILRVRNIEKSYGDKHILNNMSFDISQGDRIGLVGYNGAGKTTLANIIFGKIKPDKGVMEWHNDEVEIGYLEQSINYSVNSLKLLGEYELSSQYFEITSELGLQKVGSWQEERFEHLSGGERLKLALANIWHENSDILILDEPTNHLDYQGTLWLVEQLEKFNGTVIIISHDRYFLDQTVTKIFELEASKLTIYTGNYSGYRSEKEKRYQDQLHQFEVQQKHKERVENQVSQLQQWAGKAHRTMREQEGFKEFHGVKAKKLDRSIKSKMNRLTFPYSR